MDLYPAIDLRGGRCVRLVQGDFSAETVYGDDPVAVARTFAAAGARWIHVVDLDAARTGEPANRPVVARIVGAVPSVRIQTGGGVRGVADAAELLDSGVARVVVGTAAVERPALVAEVAARWPGQVAVGLDHRAGEIQVSGWTQGAGRNLMDVIPEVVAAGAAALIVTDIRRDGRLAGPDVDGLAALLADAGAPIIASGGVRGIADLRVLARLGPARRAEEPGPHPTEIPSPRRAGPPEPRPVSPGGTPVPTGSPSPSGSGPESGRDGGSVGLAGVIVGTAIYEGRLDLAAALDECAARPARA